MKDAISIIGTAGRGDDIKKLNYELYRKMIHQVNRIVEKIGCKNLVSGGAAWADHIAVVLSFKYKYKLTLHLPAKFENGFIDGPTAHTTDYYHKKFTEKCFKTMTSYDHFKLVKDRGAEFIIHNGFKERNKFVAESRYVIACTFGDGEYVKDGGTAHTCRCYLENCQKEKIEPKLWHINLPDLKIYKGKLKEEEFGL